MLDKENMAKKENGFDWHSHAFASSTSIIRVGREVLRSLRIAFMDTWIASINSKMEVGRYVFLEAFSESR